MLDARVVRFHGASALAGWPAEAVPERALLRSSNLVEDGTIGWMLAVP